MLSAGRIVLFGERQDKVNKESQEPRVALEMRHLQTTVKYYK